MTQRVLGPSGSPRRRRWLLVPFVLAIAAMAIFAIAASSASLPGSTFEIDADANLRVDGAAPPALDWANVTENRQADLASGGGDDSYSGGAKEDDACPGTTDGSIPPQKSDLLSFGGYHETEANGPGTLNVFWARVNDPQGTVNMDFEFNKSTVDCDGAGSAVNVTRTVGDILLQYDVDQGGAVAKLSKRVWNGSSWGGAIPLDANNAIGTINSTAIPNAQSDGLITTGSLAPRTFGEASFDLAQVFDPNSCVSFGSAMLKSRSSDSFTSQLKDFIRPLNVNINNCATVIIRKQTIPDGETQQFGFTKTYATIPATANTFNLADNGVFQNAATLGNGLTVSEDTVTATGWEFVSIDCNVAGNPSSGVTPVIAGQQVTFSLDASSDVLDCTFTNRLQQGAIVVTKTRKHAASSTTTSVPHPGVNFTVGGVTTATDANGQACFDGLSFGSHNVTETLPTGYQADGLLTKAVTVDHNATCAAGNGNTVSFSNTPLTDLSITINSQVNGGTASTVDCDNGGPDGSTDANGDGTFAVTNLPPKEGVETITCTIVIDP
jgi:hypothetical protein